MTNTPEPRGRRAGDKDPARASSEHAGAEAVQRVVVMTGMSGAGKTVGLKTLEDMGYETVDNLPLSLVESLVGPTRQGQRPLALGVDIRTRDFAVERFQAEIDSLGQRADIDARLLFMDCEDEVLRRRYSETRHRHPLAEKGRLTQGIKRERALLSPLRARANHLIDTTRLNLADLKRILEGACALDGAPGLEVSVLSFSYRHGLPPEADIVLDMRFLKNPYYEPSLAQLTGRDAAVGAYVEADPAFPPFFQSLTGMLDVLLPRYDAEGKSYLTIAVGCTGGMHRSVFVAERLGTWLRERGQRVNAAHRDLAAAGS